MFLHWFTSKPKQKEKLAIQTSSAARFSDQGDRNEVFQGSSSFLGQAGGDSYTGFRVK